MKLFIALGFYGLGATELVIIFIVLLLFLLPTILFLVTLSNTIKLCATHNRSIEPGQVWLMLIPIFGTIWSFIMVGKIADTIAAEYRQRNISIDEQRPGYNVGLAFCILSCGAWIPLLGGLCSLGALICWIIYWVRIFNYKKKLEDVTFNFGQHNPNPYPFPNQFPGQPNPPHNPNQP